MLKQKKEQLRTEGKSVFLCNFITENPNNNFMVLMGEAIGSSINPGMKIIDPNGIEYIIEEVFAESKGQVYRSEVPEETRGTTIGFKKENWDKKTYETFKKNNMIVFELR